MLPHVPTLARAFKAAWDADRMTPRYAAWATSLLGVHISCSAVVQLGQLADNVLYPGWRRREVREPIFILASARSGTTLLHRLMSHDEERFTSFKLYQTFFPSVSLDRLFHKLGRVDERLGGPGRGVLQLVERKAFGGWRGIHFMALTEPEEDENIFAYTLLSPGMFLLFPFVDELDHIHFTEQLTPRERRRIMAFYRGCLKRHLHAEGQDRTMLLKNVLAASRLEALLESFPDARVVNVVRHPYEAIPSFLNMFYVFWQTHSPEIRRDSREMKAFGRLMMAYYRHYMEVGKRLPADRFITVRYEDVVQDPAGTVERIYDRFGLEMSSEFAARLREEASRHSGDKSRKEHSLEEYGLSRDEVYYELREAFETYGFER